MTQIDELHIIRNRIVNKALIIGSFFGFISYFITLFRAFSFGFDGSIVLISSVMLLLAFVAFKRESLSLNFKVYSIMFFVLMALISGLLKFGFLVSSKAYVILIPIFVSFILEYKRALMLLIIYASVYAIFGFLYVYKIIPFTIDANEYVLTANAWLMDLSIIFLTALALLYVGRQYSDAILENLSVIKQNSKDLANRDNKFKGLFEHSFDAIIILKDGLYYEANEKALDLFGYDMDYLIGKSPKSTSPVYQLDGSRSEKKAKEKIKMALSGKPQVFEWQHERSDGHIFDASISLVAIKQGQEVFLQAVLHDVTEVKKQQRELEEYKSHLESLVQLRTEELEVTNEELIQSNIDLVEQRNALEKTLNQLHNAQQKLIESEKMASLGVLTAGVAHEINNPLNFIQSGLYSLRSLYSDQYEDVTVEESQKLRTQIIESMDEGVKRISDIVFSLNHFNRKSLDDFSECNVRVIIDNCLKILAHKTKNRIDIEKNYLREDVILHGNESELHQLFLNLLYNAVQAIHHTGIICIGLNISINKLIVEISDDGIGMNEEVMGRIFDPFFTTKEVGEGVGLGLSIVYNIVNKHKGEIKVNSKRNAGSSFTIQLPLN